MKNDPSLTLANLNLILCYPLLGSFLLALVAGIAGEIDRQIDSPKIASMRGAPASLRA